jgi:hypothetical protein
VTDQTGLPELPFPRNPGFGTGCARRRIELVNLEGRATGHLSDPFHEMRCELTHDESNVLTIEGTMLRYPTTLCPGAAQPLAELTGRSLREPPKSFYAPGVLPRNCTHLFDLGYLTIAQAARAEPRRTYEAIVPDELATPVVCELWRDGTRLLAWTVRHGLVIAPAAVNGLSLLAGFLKAASARFQGDALEAALVLARTYLISIGRPYDSQAWAGRLTSGNVALRNRCYGYAAVHGDSGRFRDGYIVEVPSGLGRSVAASHGRT